MREAWRYDAIAGQANDRDMPATLYAFYLDGRPTVDGQVENFVGPASLRP
jgi:hypothetical protein